MLISPPFLPTRAAATADSTFVANAMPPATTNCPGTSMPEGSFPVSLKLGWHGGVHLSAPASGQNVLPVRCVADGEIVFARAPVAVNSDVAHAQNYNPYGTSAAWTDNGLVIIRHETVIGDGADARDIVFYSLIAHLSELRGNFLRVANGTATPAQRQVSRKDEVGLAGRVYGAPGQVQIEIVCDDANLRKLVGRTTGNLALTADGRRDAVYGEIYFYLPAGTSFYQNAPAATQTQPAAAASHTTAQAMIVGIKYGEGDGSHPGHAVVTSYGIDGVVIGGTPVQDADAEYDLLTRATAIREAFTSAHAPIIPVTSAVYELLRFGRVLGPDALAPAEIAHWRQANYPGGQGWVNLNAAGVHKFSDADFPGWKGWKLIDDDTDDNSQCNSAALIGVVEDASAADGRLTRQELETRLSQAPVRVALNRLICKFPSEWNRDTIDARWAWLRTDAEFGLTGEDWTLFRAHAVALAVPGADLPVAMRTAHWHFHPQQFVEHFRKCGWLSEAEMAQTLPKYLFYNEHGNPRTAITTNNPTYTLTRATATTRLATHHVPLNLCIRKYIGSGRQRVAIFLAQVILETAQWRNAGGMRRLMHEWFFGQTSTANPATQFYTAFYGRGIMQLTWAGNYKDYGEYRMLPNHVGAYTERLTPATPRVTATSRHYLANPNDGGAEITWSPRYDPDFVGEDPYTACDSGGYYWVHKSFAGHSNINRACDQAFTPVSVGLVNRLVNGGGNGYYERQAYAAYLMRLLTEDVSVDITRQITLPAPKNAITVNFSRT
jgi:hydroxyethylthiazole kinase